MKNIPTKKLYTRTYYYGLSYVDIEKLEGEEIYIVSSYYEGLLVETHYYRTYDDALDSVWKLTKYWKYYSEWWYNKEDKKV